MGKLAERYQDAERSGVYRVSSAEIPLRAASEAGAAVLQIVGADTDALALQLRAVARDDRRPHVAVMRDAAALAATPELYAAVIESLGCIAADCRAKALPFFAVLVDPGAALALPRLYKEHERD